MPVSIVPRHTDLVGLTTGDDHTQYLFNAPAATARNVVSPASGSVVPLTIAGVSGQTASRQRWQNPDGALNAIIDKDGCFRGGGDSAGGARGLRIARDDVADLETTNEALVAEIKYDGSRLSFRKLNGDGIGVAVDRVVSTDTSATYVDLVDDFIQLRVAQVGTSLTQWLFDTNVSRSDTSVAMGAFKNSTTELWEVFADGRVRTLLSTALTNALGTVGTVRHNSSGTPAAGFGSRTVWQLESSTTADRDAAALDVFWGTATDASRQGLFALSAADSGAMREVMRGGANGSAATVGFLGAAAVTRRTLGAAATDAATTQTLANNLRQALIDLGLGQT